MLIGLGAIMALGPNMPSFIKAIAAADDAFKILDDESKQGQTPSGQSGIRDDKTDSCEGLVEFRNMSFSYGVRENHNALDSINLSFTRGSSTAIVGPSGAGKSTLISLLERWYEPTAGSILLDGRDVSGLDPRWLRSQIALVQQEPQLFNASIFDNIAYGLVGTGNERLSQEQKTSLVHDACREARAYDFITALPEVRLVISLQSPSYRKLTTSSHSIP
jgi:ATP-binding cassette subfamily B (MDR/TAP) protein 1